MTDLSAWLVVFGAGLALGVLAFAALWIVALVRSRARVSRAGVDGPFPRERLRLLVTAASALGAEVVDDPRACRFPFLKSRSPAPVYGLALCPVDEESRDPRDPYLVRFEAPIAGGRFLEVWPVGSPFAPSRVNMGSPGIATGDALFDGAYVVRSDDPDFARTVLGAETRALVEEGRRLGAGGRMRLNIDSLRLRLQKEEQVASPEILAALGAVGLRILEQVRETLRIREQVQFFDQAPPPAARPNCPVCAGAVVERRVECRRCRTPHHRECWDYTGACSMFACGEARFSL
ncbi:MAG TPA: RING finger protein [Planctomycetota bacterium]